LSSIKPEVFSNRNYAWGLIAEARKIIEDDVKKLEGNTALGDLKFDVALAKLQKAKELDPGFAFDPNRYLNLVAGLQLLRSGRTLGIRGDSKMKDLLVEAGKKLSAAEPLPAALKVDVAPINSSKGTLCAGATWSPLPT